MVIAHRLTYTHTRAHTQRHTHTDVTRSGIIAVSVVVFLSAHYLSKQQPSVRTVHLSVSKSLGMVQDHSAVYTSAHHGLFCKEKKRDVI